VLFRSSSNARTHAKAKRVVAKGYEESLETLPSELGLPTPLGLWEDDSVDGWGSSPGHETGSNPGEAAEHVGSNDRAGLYETFV
jgi:hypothetical protein